VTWYAPQLGFSLENATWGGCRLDEPRRFLEDFEPLGGRPRVWILVAGSGSVETDYLFAYADSIGRRLEGHRINATVRGYLPPEAALYDPSDTTRSARYTARSFPLDLPGRPDAVVLTCSSGPMAIVREEGAFDRWRDGLASATVARSP